MNLESRSTAGPKAKLAGPSAPKPTDPHKNIVTNISSYNQYQQAPTPTIVRARDREKAKKVVIEVEGDIEITNTIEIDNEVLCVKYSDDFTYLAVGCSDGTLRLYTPETTSCALKLIDNDVEPSAVSSINHRPIAKSGSSANTLTCTYVGGILKNWNMKTGDCIYSVNEERQILGLAYSSRAAKFVTVGDDSKLIMYDEETRTQERVFHASNTKAGVMDGHTSRVYAACFHPKLPQELISGGWDDTVQFWDMRQPYATRHLSGIHMCGDGLDISKSGNEILTCSWQKVNPLQLWEYNTGKLITNIDPDPHNSVLYCGKWLNKEHFVTGGSEPSTVRLVSVRTMASLGYCKGFDGGVYSVDEGPIKKQHKNRGKPQPADPLPRIACCAGKSVYELQPLQ